jgi:hypothetical protein
MSRRTGSTNLPLHGGRVPAWLGRRMSTLGAVIRRLQAHARKLLKEDVPVIPAGDYNLAPADRRPAWKLGVVVRGGEERHAGDRWKRGALLPDGAGVFDNGARSGGVDLRYELLSLPGEQYH